MSTLRGHWTLAAILAVLAPALVLGLGAWGLWSFQDIDDAQAAQNAGRILNAKVLQGDLDAAAVMDRVLLERNPKVIVLGPSYANTNVRPALLADRLGIAPTEIQMMSVPNSVGSHWYSILKYRVFGGGYQPKLIVVVSGLQSMLLTTPLTESSYVNLRIQLPPEGDPLIQQKVQGSADLWLARFREQRGKLREGLFSVVRYRPAFTLLGLAPNQTRRALDRVFDDTHVDMSLHGTAIPVVESSRVGERAYTPDLLPSPENSFMRELSELAAANGSGIVWVRPPMSPHIPEHLDDVVLPGVQEQVAALVEAAGSRFVDMRGLPMTSAMFKNEDHMNNDGSRRFTEALARALIDLDAMTPGARPGQLPPMSFVRTETGTDDPVPPALAAVSGPGRWLGPGATVTYTSDEAWDPVRGTFLVTVLAELAANTKARTPEVRIGRQDVRLPPPMELDARAEVRHTVDVARPLAPFTVTLRVPDDAPWTRIVALALGPPNGRTFLEGNPAALDGSTVDLLGVTRLVDGTVVDQSLHPTYLNLPGRVPGADREITDLVGNLAAFETEKWPFLSDESLQTLTTWGSRCSPLRVTENGSPLEGANVPCLDVKRKGGGRSCHTTERLYFSASDGTDPATNGRQYRMVLDEGRRCDGAVWLYPVDHFTLAFPTKRLSELGSGARYFILGAKYLQYRAAEVRVQLRVDGATVIDEIIQSQDLKKEARKVWKLDPPIRSDARSVEVEIENLDYTFHLISDIALSEQAPPPL